MLRKVRKNLFAWGRRLWGVWSVHDLIPSRDFIRLPGDGTAFLATGEDPQLRFKRSILPGWYVIEIRADLPLSHTQARMYLDDGHGESEANAYAMLLRSGRLGKRLLHIGATSKFRFDPFAQAGEFRVHHFCIKRVTPWFARSRMRAKLAASQSDDAKHAILAGRALWDAYCALFEHRGDAVSYNQWLERVEPKNLPTPEAQLANMTSWNSRPRFSIITPTWNTPETVLRHCLDSVLAQTYGEWELCLADDASTAPHVRRTLQEYAARDARFRVVFRTENGHISAASNSALSLACGEFIVLLDHDDTLAPHALFSVAKALQATPNAQIVYSDEDKLDMSGRRCDPFFKPDFSLDLIYSQNFIAHLLVLRRQLVVDVGGFRLGYEGSQDYDLLLRCIGRLRGDPQAIVHIPQVLYHWRMSEGSTSSGHDAKDYATDAALRALSDHFADEQLLSQASVIAPGLYRHRWPLPSDPPLVSVIIPTRDGGEGLRQCIESILSLTAYPRYEIIIVDNQSRDVDTLGYMDALEARGAARLLRYDRPFNYSAINNFAAVHAQGSVLAFVNDDVEVINGGWLEEMVSHAVRPGIGCVGAKLYYPDNAIQHAGVVLGIGGVAGHSHKYLSRSSDGYFGRLRVVHNVSAVTGAAMVVRRELFDKAGGFDEVGLTVAFNDVDFCLRVADLGVRNLMTPFAELYHHESRTRGSDQTPESRQRFQKECAVMHERWGSRLRHDPFYNPNLTLTREDYSLAESVDVN